MTVEDNTSKNCVLGVFSYLISLCYDFLFSFLKPLVPNTLATRPLIFLLYAAVSMYLFIRLPLARMAIFAGKSPLSTRHGSARSSPPTLTMTFLSTVSC